MSKYEEDSWGWVPKRVTRYRLSGFWAIILSFEDLSSFRGAVFSRSLGFKVGEGGNISFWFDDWAGVGSLCHLFPRVFRVVSNKEFSVKEHILGFES